MYCVWRAYLEGTVQVTQSRIGACDNYRVQVAEPAKTARLQKEQQLRKVTPRVEKLAIPGSGFSQLLHKRDRLDSPSTPFRSAEERVSVVLLKSVSVTDILSLY